ncbi:MAG TPA: pseudouridine synthase [Candidatus Marinimicrobia bacterium]|nr:pseudouridine synthase [Candidatus Neomarinimicrobiota bacterium]HBN45942.1 rRNA pseudouridine synthase [Candidatus Neomarinimicrobiota bacterium]HJL74332.1 pseudouridine synthase [Candidatus Neomarinimicrobiota bacterium]HJM70203.1 pseudouridine synthase [Candidatus Neomarinimicrobiota bacterium]
MRLNKYLAQGGVASRREADRLILAATTTVNGILQTDPAFNVNENDKVFFDGRRVRIEKDTYVLVLNKPKGFITTAHDPQGRKTVMELVPRKPRLFTVGRLDRNSTGLLLLTNDGSLAQELMLPKNKIPRVYEVEIDRLLEKSDIMKMRCGIFIGNRQRGKAKVLQQKVVKKRVLIRLELCQGKNREIRRIMAVLKRKIFSLHRISYGPINLQGVPEGSWRKLTIKEMLQLRKK